MRCCQIVLAGLLILWLPGGMGAKGGEMKSQGPVAPRRFVQIDWSSKVRAAARRAGQENDVRAWGFCAGRAPRVVGLSVEPGEVWIAGIQGEDARRLARHEGAYIRRPVCAPDAEEVAYNLLPNDPKALLTDAVQTWVAGASAPGGHLVAERAQVLGWAPDSKEPYVLRKEAEAVYERHAGLVAEGKWRVLKAAAPWREKALTEVTPVLEFTPPGSEIGESTLALSPDAQQVAYCRDEPGEGGMRPYALVVRSLVTGAEQVYQLYRWGAGPGPFDPFWVGWSGDGHWLLVAGKDMGAVEAVEPIARLVELPSGRLVDVGRKMEAFSTGQIGVPVALMGAGWAGQRGHTLWLAGATRRSRFAAAPTQGPPPQEAWVLYDADTDALTPVVSAVSVRGFMGWGRVGTSADGRYFAVDGVRELQ